MHRSGQPNIILGNRVLPGSFKAITATRTLISRQLVLFPAGGSHRSSPASKMQCSHCVRRKLHSSCGARTPPKHATM